MVGRSRTRRYAAAAALGVLLVAPAGCSVVADEAAAPEPVRIAADLSLTGAGSALGTVYRNALELRVEQVNQQGLLGDRRLELEVQDNRSDPATSATNLERLSSDPDLTAIVTGACGQCVVTAANTINERGVPTIALTADTTVSDPVADRQYVFKLGPNPDHVAAALAGALASRLAGTEEPTIGLVTTDDPYGQAAAVEMGTALGRVNIGIAVTEQVAAGGDLAAAADRIAAYQPEPDAGEPFDPEAEPQTGPDAVVVWAGSVLAGEVAASLRSAGYSGPLFLDARAAGELFLRAADRAVLTGATMVFTETMVMDEVVATSPAQAARKTWFRDYTARFGTYHAYSSFAADAVGLVVDAVNRAGTTDRATVRDIMEVTQLAGLSGALRLTPSQHSGLMPQALTVLTARGDRWRLGGGA